MAKRPRSVARCSACGQEQTQWTGRCPGCDAWGTIEEQAAPAGSGRASRSSRPDATPIAQVPLDAVDRQATGVAELDRVLGGGLVPGSVVLLGGEPGVGKSTLLLQAAHALAGDERRPARTVLYLSAEESAGQVRLRAERLGALADHLLVAAETTLPAVLELADRHRPDVLVVDSIQTITDPDRDSSAGSVVQVRECASALVRHAKARGVATLLVGHVTKDGTIAGPRVLEHLVDVVLGFEGDPDHALRLLRAVKNRFGSTGEVGCFEMVGHGLAEVADPSRLFLAGHDRPVPGVAVTIAVEGPRPLAVEVQALTMQTQLATPRRQAAGLDPARVAMLTAVLDRRAHVEVARQDLYASAVGGVRLREPAADLAICLAVASSVRDRPVPADTVAVGEVGLAGEVRATPQLARRLTEAARLGYRRALVPASYDGPAHGLRLEPVTDLARGLRAGVDDLSAVG